MDLQFKLFSVGYELLKVITELFGPNILLTVEDLDDITPEVFKLRDYFQLFCVRILQMGIYRFLPYLF
ncbi:unnamed protein product [Rotaria sp. Silwood2]|nr:unnamed protein product [Rotaria sp. Silwood2]